MAMSLDEKIEELERIVEQRLDLSKDSCKTKWNGLRCTLPADHVPEESHNFMIDSPGSRQLYSK